MKEFLKRTLHIPSLTVHDKKAFVLLMLLTFSFGAFWIVFEIFAYSSFLTYVGISNLPVIIGISGIVCFTTFIIAFQFSKNSKNKKGSLFAVASLILVSSILVVFAIYTELSIIYSALLVVSVPLTIFGTIFYNSTIEKFIPSEVKNTLSWYIDIAKYSAIIITGVISLILSFQIIHITQIAYISAFAGLVFFIISIVMYKSGIQYHGIIDTGKLKKPLKHLFHLSVTQILLLAFFSGTLIQIVFLKEVETAYPSIWGMAKVLALFLVTMYAFAYIAKQFFLPRILNTFHSPFSLVTSAAALILSAGIGSIFIWIAQRFQLFTDFSFALLTVVIIKILFENSRINVDAPSIKVGLISQVKQYESYELLLVAIASSIGIVLASASAFSMQALGLDTLIYLVVVLFAAAIWFFYTTKAAKDFTHVLNTFIHQKSSKKPKNHLILDEIVYNINLFDPDLYNFFSRIYPDQFNKLIERLLTTQTAKFHKYALENINRIDYSRALKILKKENLIHNPHYPKLNLLIDRIQDDLLIANDTSKIAELAESNTDDERLKAAQLINYNESNNLDTQLISLLKDYNPGIKTEAIISSIGFDSSEISYLLVDYLSSDEYYPYAFHALKHKGDKIMDYIDQVLKHEVLPDKLIIRIIKLYEHIATFKSVEKISEFIDHPG
jgi:hypothetical protein